MNAIDLVQHQQQQNSMTEIASSRQAQEVQAAIIVAQRFPRDTTRALSRIIEDCKRKSLAEKAVYTYPRGNQTVSGPSIRLAETMARAWGNMDFGVIELEQKPARGSTVPGESIMMAYAWDLETNTRVTKIFTVKHKRDTKNGSKNLSDERDIYEIAANNGARRLRACILSVIPADIVDSAVEQCEKTMEGGQGPLIDRVRNMTLYFKEIGVTQEMLEKRLGHKIDVTTEAELVSLKKIATSLKDNFADRADFFEVGEKPKEQEETAPKVEIKRVPVTKEKETAEPPKADSKPEPTVSNPKAKLMLEVSQEMKRLGWKPPKLLKVIQDNFSKTPDQISTEELEVLVSIMCGLEEGS